MRASRLASVVLLATLSAAAMAQTTTPPPAPFLTIGGDTKQLLLDWEPVPGAGIYRVMANTAARGYFEPVSERLGARRTSYTIPIAVHKQLWSTTRYLVMACNPAGCTRSNEVSPSNATMLSTIGYFKASNTGANDRLGTQIAMSADGTTMAVSADGEDDDNEVRPEVGAVYIYRRNGREWTQETILRPLQEPWNVRFGSGSGIAYRYMGLSADGALLAVGWPTRTVAGKVAAGAVYTFRRAADNTWTQQEIFNAPDIVANDQFGFSVDVSADGNYLKMSSVYPQSSAGAPTGRTYVWHHNGSSWTQQAIIAPFYPGDRCLTTRMSTDARWLVAACQTPTVANKPEGRLVTYQRFGENTWTRVADQTYLWLDNPNMALNHDASWIAVHAGNEYYPACISIFRRDQLAWVDRSSWIGGGGESGFGYDAWGHSMDISRNGEYIALGDPQWNAVGAGSLENYTPRGSADGAVLVLRRRPSGSPHHGFMRLLKAANPGSGDHFGASVAFGSSDGFYLAVGAPGEDGATTGIDGNQTSESATDAGAVYLH